MKSERYINKQLCLVVFAAIFVLLQSCVALNTYPTMARAGDTITLSLGSVDGLDKSRLQIFYTPQATGVPINISSNIRSVLKVYPDRTSSASMADIWTSQLTVYSGHAMWMNVVVVDLPASLPTGLGYFTVDFASSVRVASTSYVASAESVRINTEILPGTGIKNDFFYYAANPNPVLAQIGNFTRLEPLPHVVLRPGAATNYASGANHPAAAEFKIKLPVSGNVSILDDSEVHVIWDYKPGEDNKQIQLNWSRQLDVITVNVLVPTDLTITEQQMQFSIVINPAMAGNKINIDGTALLQSFRYYDLNGVGFTPAFTPEVVVMK
jgi:hypothetical protein